MCVCFNFFYLLFQEVSIGKDKRSSTSEIMTGHVDSNMDSATLKHQGPKMKEDSMIAGSQVNIVYPSST